MRKSYTEWFINCATRMTIGVGCTVYGSLHISKQAAFCCCGIIANRPLPCTLMLIDIAWMQSLY